MTSKAEPQGDMSRNGSTVVFQDVPSSSDSDHDGKGDFPPGGLVRPNSAASGGESPSDTSSPGGTQPQQRPPRGMKTIKSSPALATHDGNHPQRNAPQQDGGGAAAADARLRRPLGAKAKLRQEVEAECFARLDRFFGDDAAWQRIVKEVKGVEALTGGTRLGEAGRRGGVREYRICVPSPYPGVQYRNSKNYNDRCKERFAENHVVVMGELEDGGEWLRVTSGEYLPTSVGPISILEDLTPLEAHKDNACSSCCTGSAGGARRSSEEQIVSRKPGR